MGRIICASSGKGGVGKTTFISNLATALVGYGKSVVIVDANLTTPNIGLQMGIPMYPITLQDVLSGESGVRDALYKHKSGVSVISTDISLNRLTKASSGELANVFYHLSKDFDFVLIDTAAGLGREALVAIKSADEIITITNPEMPALVDALKLDRIAKDFGTENLGAVVNKMRYNKNELSADEVKNFLGMTILGKIPEDENVRKAIKNKEAVVTQNPHSKAARSFKRIAADLIGIEPPKSPFDKLFGWLR